MGVTVTDGRTSQRVLAAVLFVVTLVALLLLLPARASGASPSLVTATDNASGRYDTVVLRDLGKRTAAVVSMVADGGAFTADQLWRSRKGKLDVRKVKWLAADVNADGFADGVALLDLGKGRSRLVIYRSNGDKAVPKTAWTSKKGAFSWARAKLAVGDVNGDGRDDVIALYDRGKAGAALYRFISTGSAFKMSIGWKAPRSRFSCAKAQLAAGDVTRDGKDDATVLYKSTTTSSRLYVFVAGASKFTKKTFWSGKYAAGRAQLATGDADSDGDFDAICLYRKPDNTGRLDVFLSSKKSFAKPAVWYDGAGGPLPATSCRFAVGDVTGDGRADAVVAQPTGDMSSSVTTCVSTASGFEPQVWWDGDWIYPTLRLGVAPSLGMVVSDKAEVLDASSMGALRAVTADGTLTFAGEPAQLGRVQAGDVLLAGPSDTFPTGLCRKVTAVGEQSGKVAVETTDAALADIIDQGEVAFDKRITLDDLSEEGIVYPGVRLKRDLAPPGTLPVALGGGYTEGFGFDLTTTIAGKVDVEGAVWLDPSAYCDWDIGFFGLKSAYYTQVISTRTDLTVSFKETFDEEVKQTIYKQTLAVITIMIGPVPVVVTPEFEVYVGASGEVTAGVTAGVSIATEARVGITYDDDDGWDKTFSSTYELTPQPPQLFGALELKGFAGAG
ncbi:MAG: VCBS repeat-containing protein, partial [Actinobacteria bacterium]|nr:VCBS repeat-containing protein [Actinomycetota bacterium]